MIVLDKTHYKYWRICPRYGWNRFHKKITNDSTEIEEHRYGQGNEVERLSYGLFEEGFTVKGERKAAADHTAKLVNDPTTKILYQATALSPDNLLAKADIIEVNHQQKYLDIYEVKMQSNIGFAGDRKDGKKKNDKKKQEQFLSDIGFQTIAFQRSGYQVRDTYIVHINPDFVAGSDQIDPNKLFIKHKLNREVQAILPQISDEIKQAYACFQQAQEPTCNCRYKPKTDRCSKFMEYNPDIPSKNSIFALTNIRVNTLKKLLDSKIISIQDIDSHVLQEIELKPRQLNQVKVVHSNKEIIDKPKIKQLLKPLQEPLHFLDYEAIAYPIPRFEKSKPHQTVIFQYSLHILRDGQLKHYEHLMREISNQALQQLIEDLRTNIQSKGSIIVWHQSAETTFQKNLKRIMPETQEFLDGLKERFFDLEKIFLQQAYLHPDFEGKTSLKIVLPVLTGKSYKDLTEIQDGQQASIDWDRALGELPDQKQKIFNNLIEYCKQDTSSMVDIYKKLKELAEEVR